MEIPFKVGERYFIRMVTYHMDYMVGQVSAIVGKFIEMKDARWVADSGRFSNAIKEGTLNEVEPVGTAYVNTDSVIDAFPLIHKLPNKQK